MAQFCWIYTTTASCKEARKISDHLLKKNLIACSNIFPSMESHYKWKGQTVKGKECAVIFKTQSKNFKKVQREILKLHSYEVPCIIQINCAKVSAPYAAWMKSLL